MNNCLKGISHSQLKKKKSMFSHDQWTAALRSNKCWKSISYRKCSSTKRTNMDNRWCKPQSLLSEYNISSYTQSNFLQLREFKGHIKSHKRKAVYMGDECQYSHSIIKYIQAVQQLRGPISSTEQVHWSDSSNLLIGLYYLKEVINHQAISIKVIQWIT